MIDMSVESPKSPSRRKFLIGAAATLAAGGIAAAVLGGQRNETQVAVSPTPARTTEPSRAPEPTPTKTAEPTKTPEPTPNPVEVAIKEGKLELKGDWDRYFTSVTAEEAEQLLKKANEGIISPENFKLILPFDPRKTPDLVLQDTGYTLSGKQAKLMGANNIPAGTTFYAQETGMGRLFQDSADILFSLQGSTVTGFVLPKENSKTFLPIRTPTSVKVGTAVAVIGSKGPTMYSKQFSMGEYQALLTLGPDANNGSISQLLKKEGKFIFVAQST